MTKWFGESWGAPACDPDDHIETPVGMPCIGHEHLHEHRSAVIEPGDQGITMPFSSGVAENRTANRVAFHLDCWLHEIGADRLS